MYKFGKSSEANLIGVKPSLVAVPRRALSYGLMDFAVVQGVRDGAIQNAYYAQGRNALAVVNDFRRRANLAPITDKENRIVTNTILSKHLIQADGFGHAIDLVPFVNGRMDWESHENFYFLATLMLRAAAELGEPVRWGGHFRSLRDSPHFETIS